MLAMTNRLGATFFTALGAALSVLAHAATARAQSPAACVAAFDRGQELQSGLKLRAAREQYLACSRETCHTMVRKDCAARLEEVVRDLPSVILGARDESGRDLPEARVLVDGVEVEISKPGAALPIDPGEHTVRFDLGGFRSHTENVVVRVGEKNRAVVATLLAPTPLVVPPAKGGRGQDEKPVTASSRTPLVLALAGGSLLSFGGFAAFGLAGLSERNHLIETCASWCSEQQASVVRNRYLAADIFLAVGVVAGAAAAILYLTEPSAKGAVVSASAKR